MSATPDWLRRVIAQLPDEQHCRALALQAQEAGNSGVEDGATWPYLWPGGLRLAADLPQLLQEHPTPSSTLDLGCGRGLLGFAAMHWGLPRVTCVDGDAQAVAAVGQQARNLGLDQLQAQLHAWDGSAIPGGPFACILGGDVLYRPQFHRALLRTVAAQLRRDGEAWLADPRQQLEPQLPIIAAELGLTWSHSLRPGPYSLCRLRWR